MNKKIIGIFVCMLLIVTAISVTGATNVQTIRNFWENNDLERNPSTYQSTPVDSPGDIAIAIVAEVTLVDDPYNLLGGAINVGDKIKGKYIYDSTTPDSYPGYQFVGMYEHFTTPYGIELKCGGLVFKTDPNNVEFAITIFNDFYYYYGDAYAPFSVNNLDLSNGNKVSFIGWALTDSTGNALSSDALPTTAPVLSDWSGNELFIDGYNPSDPFQLYYIEARVTKATLSRSKTRDVHSITQPILNW